MLLPAPHLTQLKMLELNLHLWRAEPQWMRTHTMEAEDQARAVALQEMTDVWGNIRQMEAPDDQRTSREGRPLGVLAQSAGSKAEAGQLDPATAQLLRVMVKSLVRLDEDVSRLRADCNFMLFVDSVSERLREVAQTWQEAFTKGKVTTSLRVVLFCGLLRMLKEAVATVQTDDAIRDRLLRVGWLEDGINALLPSWHYYRWDPQTQRQVVSEREALPQDKLLRCLDVLERGCSLPTTLLRFRSTHKLGQETQAEVVPFMISISLRGPQAAECHEALTVLAYNGALKMRGLRLRPERSQQSAAIKEMTEAYLAVPFTDWTRRPQQWTRKPAEEETKN
ncbi:jockey\pol [Symbiodinium sp. KB8]|nr:jockey\pol [Symbiodinium sp. KB8]